MILIHVIWEFLKNNREKNEVKIKTIEKEIMDLKGLLNKMNDSLELIYADL